MIRAAVTFFICALMLAPGAAHGGVAVTGGRYVMGTVLEATIYAPDRATGGALLEMAFAEAARLDAMMTTYNDRSALMQLNRAAGEGGQRVPPELAELLAAALGYSRLTRGTFDVTVGPLVSLWSSAASSYEAAELPDLSRARALVGSEKIIVHNDATVELARAGMALDLSGIAKGYALDRIVAILCRRGVTRAYLSFGQSSIWALGAPPGARGWTVALRDLAGGFSRSIRLHDRALSVSSSFSGAGRRRVAHVIDPRSGRPLVRDLEACVIASNATQAEALSKALLILGGHDGIALIERQTGTGALLLAADGSAWTTSDWPRSTDSTTFESAAASRR
jgi:thiamine biosynthesis lipoprotein